ncbi:MAG: CoA pyrophosphatase [Alphaproteobacteria bacterium]
MVTRDFVLERLRASAEAAAGRVRDASGWRLRGDRDFDPSLPEPTKPRRSAAVLVPLVEHTAGMHVLLTQRTEHLSDHAGQVAFPGGRIEETDADAVAAALRETEEEIGLARSHVETAGRLDDYETGTGFVVTPIVGLVRPPFPLQPDPREVAAVFEVPLSFVLDRRNHERRTGFWRGRERTYFAMPYEGRFIWGATAGMLINLCDVLER